jgi:hypothetical protein
VATAVRETDVASFPAIRAIVEAVHAETNVFHALADRAVSLAAALILGLVALRAEHWTGGHRCLLARDFT